MTMPLSELADLHNVLVMEPREVYDKALRDIVLFDPPRAVYDAGKCIEALMQAEGWTHEEATEWLEYNAFCAYLGAGTPLFFWPDKGGEGDGSEQDEDDGDDWP
jgi:hypothetical protein